jgi:hypothetical protein
VVLIILFKEVDTKLLELIRIEGLLERTATEPVDQGADLTIGTGFMLENAVETVAKQNPGAKFLLIDSPILDAKGAPQSLPNVRTVVFKEDIDVYRARQMMTPRPTPLHNKGVPRILPCSQRQRPRQRPSN